MQLTTMAQTLASARTLDNGRELALLQSVANGDRAAFEELYRDYHRRLARFLARLTRRQELVEEAINDTFWIVWQKAGTFRGGSLVSTWIMGIAYRCTLKTLRRNGGVNAPGPALEDDHPDTEQALDADVEEQREWILRGLSLLPVEQRVTMQLAYYLGHSLDEIAQIMDCPLSTVKARMFHARVKLRNVLPRLGGMDETSA